MWMVLLITLLAFLILEYIIPFSKNIKWIEHSSKAYYQAASGIEKALLFVGSWSVNPWDSLSVQNNWVVSYNYSVAGSGTTLPIPWEWVSEYDTDWNTLAFGTSLQLEVGDIPWINWASSYFEFRAPQVGWTGNPSLSWSTLPIVNWQLASQNDLLSAKNDFSGAPATWITVDEINDYYYPGYSPLTLENTLWERLEDGDQSFEDFYTAQCQITGASCTLKFSVVNPLVLTNSLGYEAGTQIPYLEWRFIFNTPIALRYAGLSSQWSSYGFQKNIEVKVPQQSIIEAFWFSVFQ